MGRVLSLGARWDWDLAGSLKRMYKQPRNRPTLPRPGSARHSVSQDQDENVNQEALPTQPIASLMNGILEAFADGFVEEVRVAIRSPTGEVTHKTFFPSPPLASGDIQDGVDVRREANELDTNSL